MKINKIIDKEELELMQLRNPRRWKCELEQLIEKVMLLSRKRYYSLIFVTPKLEENSKGEIPTMTLKEAFSKSKKKR